MTNKFRKAEKNSSKSNNLIVILAISLFLVMISGAAVIMNQEVPKNESEVSSGYNGKEPDIDVNTNQSVSVENEEDTTVNTEIEENKTEEEKPKVFKFPCEVEIVTEYSGNTPVFSDILQDWRTHPAIDYASAEQFDVKAISDGVIEDIYTDGLMGVTVLVDHGKELKSVYQGLDENVSVEKGDNVTVGMVIGKGGMSSAIEQYEGKYSLHFAMIDNGQYKDPAEYISQ